MIQVEPSKSGFNKNISRQFHNKTFLTKFLELIVIDGDKHIMNDKIVHFCILLEAKFGW